MREYKVVRGEVKVTNDLLPTSRQGHIVNLNIPNARLDSIFSSSKSLCPGCFPRLYLSNPCSLHALAVT